MIFLLKRSWENNHSTWKATLILKFTNRANFLKIYIGYLAPQNITKFTFTITSPVSSLKPISKSITSTL